MFGMRRILFLLGLCAFETSTFAVQAGDAMNAGAERYAHLVLALGQHDRDYVDGAGKTGANLNIQHSPGSPNHQTNTPEILDQSHNRYSSNQEPAITTMKRITSVAMALTTLFGLAVSGCDKKTSDDLKKKAEETKQTVESKAKEAKKAADKQIEKAKEAAKDAEPKLKEFGEKAKEATQNAMEKTKEAADSAAGKLKEATNTSPQPVSPTPAP
jgi:type IV secretory pathway VirB10-like protein